MAIVVDAPQGPQAASGSQLISIGAITAAGKGNALPIPVNGARVFSVDNRSDAGLMVQLFTAGEIASPYVEIIDPSKKRSFNFGMELDRVILSNITSPNLPAPFLNFLFPTLPASQNLTDGFAVLSWTTASLDVQDAENDSAVTVNNILGTVLTAPNNSLLGTMTIAGGALDTLYTFTLPAGTTSIMISTNQHGSPHASDWQKMTHCFAYGVQSGSIYFDTAQPSGLPYVFSVFNADTQITIATSCAASAFGLYFTVFALSAPGSMAVQNVGNTPLLVQPASGSSQTVVPGTAAANGSLTANGALFSNSLSIQTGLAIPASLYALSVSVEAQVALVPTPPIPVNISAAFKLIGRPSGKVVYLTLLVVNIPAGTAGSSSNAGNSASVVFPFPLPLKTMFGNDTTMDASVDEDGALLRNPAMVLVTS